MTRPTALLILLQLPLAWLLAVPAVQPCSRSAMQPLSHAVIRSSIIRMQEEEAPAAEAPAEEEKAEDPVKAEKKALREAIADIEKGLIKARGELVSAKDGAKDAGEAGYMLLAANFERFRQSARSEIDSQKGYGKVAAVRALLPFAERFTELQCERKTGEECDADDEIHKYYGGIYKQYTQLLDSWKVTEYTVSPGDKFDIKIHQTVESVSSDDAPAGSVIECIESGWMMDGDVVRLAKCKVSTGPEKVEEEAPAEEEGEAEAE